MAGRAVAVNGELGVIIVDDEPPAIRRLERLIAGLADIKVLDRLEQTACVIERCRQLKPDVILLDVEMPGIDGIGLARELHELDSPPAVIFVTAYEEYAVDAFELAAVDYLIKPVRAERLGEALDRVRQKRPDRPAALTARLGERLMSIPVVDIRVLVAEDKYTCVHHVGGEALVEDSLVSLEQRFPDRFVRVHRNALVSALHLRGLSRDANRQVRVEVEGALHRPEVSRRNLARVRRLLKGGG